MTQSNQRDGGSGGPSGEDQRRHQRVHTRIEIPYWKYVKVKRKQEVHIGFVKNLSKGGFFIECEIVFGTPDEVGFEFYLPNSAQAVSGVAKVAWQRPYDEMNLDPSSPSGMGLEFVKFDGDGEATLADFIEQELRKSQGKKHP